MHQTLLWLVAFSLAIAQQVGIHDSMPTAAVEHPSAAAEAPPCCGVLSATDFGANGDGKTDNTTALNAAVAAALPQGKTIYFPVGTYRFASRPNPIGTGVRIVGGGSVGSTPGYGTYFVADYNEPDAEAGFLTWDGSYGSWAGTGGGIEQVVINRANARTGGTGIKLTGHDDGHRAGFFTISNVMVTATSGNGSWAHNLIIDGSCCTTKGGQGVRDTYINNFWAAEATATDESVLMMNAVQVFWHGGEVFPAGTGRGTGITITGGGSFTANSTNIFLTDIYVAGNLLIDRATNVSYSGLIGGDLRVGPEAVSVVVSGIVGGTITSNSKAVTLKTNQESAVSSHAVMHAGPKPNGISGGDMAASRTPTTGAYWLGSDGKGYILRDADGLIHFSLPIVTSAILTGRLANTDAAGQLTLSNGTATYRFSGRYASPPICTCADTTAINACRVSATQAALTITGIGDDVINYICAGRD